METTAVEIHDQHKNLGLQGQGYSTFPNEILWEFYLLELKCKIEKDRHYLEHLQELMYYVS